MSGACLCASASFVEAMLSYLAQTDSYFGGCQRDSVSLSQQEKVQYLHSTLHQSVSTFIMRYGSKLTPVHVSYFTENFSENGDLMYQLELLKKDQKHQGQRVKNRRFTAMKNLMSEGDYFSDEQMKHRDPLLYEQMIGQHLSEDEIKSQSDKLLREHTGLSTVLLEQIDSKDNAAVYNRQVSRQECQFEEYDSDEELSEEEEEGEVADEEKGALKEEFLHIMQERFMAGLDSDFNYESVDGNDAYDDVDQEMRDEEEKYFDGSDEDGCETGPSPLAADEYDY